MSIVIWYNGPDVPPQKPQTLLLFPACHAGDVFDRGRFCILYRLAVQNDSDDATDRGNLGQPRDVSSQRIWRLWSAD